MYERGYETSRVSVPVSEGEVNKVVSASMRGGLTSRVASASMRGGFKQAGLSVPV